MSLSPFSLNNSLSLLRPKLQAEEAFHLVGLHNPTALALLLSQDEILQEDAPQLIVFPEHSELQEFKKALQIFHSHLSIYELPAFDVPPYSGLYPNKKYISERLYWLHRASEAVKGEVFLATTEALSQNTLPTDVFLQSQILLEKDTTIPEGFIEKLTELGFLSVPTVEDIGTFASRGGIFDIYSPAHRQPFRVELFGDVIESIRFFDPNTQRSTEETDRAFIIPAREALYEKIPLDKIFANFNHSLEKTQGQEEDILEVRRSLAQQQYFFGVDFLLTHFYEKLASPLDFFNVAPRIWIFQKDEVYRKTDHFIADLKEQFKSDDSSIFRPNPEKLYTKFDALPWPDANRLVEVERIELEKLDEDKTVYFKSFSLDEFANKFQGLSHDLKAQKEYLKERLETWKSEKYKIGFAAQSQSSAERLQLLLEKIEFGSSIIGHDELPTYFSYDAKADQLPIFVESLPSNLRLPEDQLLLLRDVDFWKRKAASRRSQQKDFKDRAEALSFGELKPGDLVVHRQHGVGIYDGLNVMDIDGVKAEFLQLRYKDNDRLYLPVYRISQLQKYSGPASKNLVDKLGSTSWAKTSGKVKSQVRDIASQLIKLYAKRSQASKVPFSAPDDSYHDFENNFPYEETEDQLRAINDVIGDMTSEKPMDRLICGDVGFGKTEVALRAAFKAAEDGRQVGIIAPTTILSFQHFETFKKRFSKWPLEVAALNRFVSAKEQKETLKKLKNGEVDVVIGTHRLLSKDVEFKDLGLLIIDEEQKFGVAHKEKLRKMREGVDTLTMSATPIPRTLNMSLMGIRDLSLINTPPEDRLPTRTYVSRFDEQTISKAVKDEVQRGGQVFFLHNRVQSIYGRADELRNILPKVRIAVAHGQMKESELEDTMMRFFKHEIDVLICTAIIESGMDIPKANTIFIDDAHMFGVSQLYQLRGRVGRSKERAYCYLLLPKNKKLDADAQERLRIIQENSALGSGIRVAQYDLELRGAGDLLGAEQSGHIKAVGYEMYMELLEEAVSELKGEEVRHDVEPEINLRIPAFIPDSYMPDLRMRLSYYKALSQITDPYELDTIEDELRDQFGKLPESVMNLMGLMLIRKDCRDLGVRDCSAGSSWLTLAFTEQTKLPPQEVIRLTSMENKKYQITPDQRLKIRMKEITWPRVHEELELLIKLIP